LTITKNRNAYYALFSRLFLQEMDEKTLRNMQKSHDFENIFQNYSKWEKKDTKSIQKLIEENLNVDFTDITILHLIPYESFYTREDGMIESGGDNRVISFYNDYGFRVDLDKARAVSPDHIGIELEFMHLLTKREMKALDDNDQKAAGELKKLQKEFLQKHLLKFSPMYLINVYEEARTPFYKDAAKALLEFLLEDYAYVKETV